MKTEAEIRQHLSDLLVCMNAPCDCDATGHVRECREGRNMMAAVCGTLQWLLGEREQYREMVEYLRREAGDFRAAGVKEWRLP